MRPSLSRTSPKTSVDDRTVSNLASRNISSAALIATAEIETR